MIVYLHGFNSAPASHKAQALRRYMEAHELGTLFACPALPHRPWAAVRVIESELARHGQRRVTLVGSSLGGFYATWFAEQRGLRAVLINPAITPHVGLQAYLGMQRNLYTREEYEVTPAHLEGWRALCLERVDPERYLLLLETGDELLDWRETATKYEGARMVIRFGGDHTLQSFPEHLNRVLHFAGLTVG